MLVETALQFDAVCSGVRFELITFLVAAGPCSIAALAEQMDRPADGLYHHMRKLSEAGLVREVGFEKSGRQLQTIYDSVADHFAFDVDFESGRNVDRILQIMRATLRRSERIMQDAIEAGAVSFDPKSRNSFIRGDTAWLDTNDLNNVVNHLQAIIDIFEAGRRKKEGDLFAVTFNLSPLVRSRSSTMSEQAANKSLPSGSRKKK